MVVRTPLWCSRVRIDRLGRVRVDRGAAKHPPSQAVGAEGTQRPAYRITCLFVDRRFRRKGLAAVAVQGALALMGEAGGGLVEAYPHDLPLDKKISSSFLYNATRTMYERLGFTYQRPKGAVNCVMTTVVAAR
jgi:GNAT superfamily N-acetyltransferase